MKVHTNLEEWRAARAGLTGRIGFVPTMGALHAGHAALIERSVAECDVTVLSIYVNPTQFNNPADLAHYPRTLDADLALAERAGRGRGDHADLRFPLPGRLPLPGGARVS
jgi:pantoate--beta-alanine ligase